MIMPVFVEHLGEECLVGQIDAQPASGEGFTYSDCWLAKPGAKPLSVSLPLQAERRPRISSSRRMRDSAMRRSTRLSARKRLSFAACRLRRWKLFDWAAFP